MKSEPIDQSIINQSINQSISQSKPSIQLKIGVSTGPLVGGLIGSKRRFFRLFGDSVNVAARMASNASTNEILINQSTYLAVVSRAQNINQSINQSNINQSTNPSNEQNINQSINQSVYRLIDLIHVQGHRTSLELWFNQSINQSTNQSINQCTA